LVKADSTLLSATGSLCPQLDPPAVTGNGKLSFGRGRQSGRASRQDHLDRRNP
jgi:hypothetical protein